MLRCPTAGNWAVGRNGAYGYNHEYLGDAGRRELARKLQDVVTGSTGSLARIFEDTTVRSVLRLDG